jgi:hypothetical protein
MQAQRIAGLIAMGWLLPLGAAACDIPGLGRDGEGIEKDRRKAGKTAAGSVDCSAYCKKQKKCFPGAAVGEERWDKRCKASCEVESKAGGVVGAFYAAVAACSDEKCGKANAACLADELVDAKPRDGEPRLDVSGLPSQCVRVRACADATVAGASAARRDGVRQELYKMYRPMFANLRKIDKSTADISCRMIVENDRCAGPGKPTSAGASIDVDCQAYCAKQSACYPELSKDSAWLANCRGGCKDEAKAGTSEAAFFAAVAACRGAACGDPHGDCVVKKVADKWPASDKSGWDMRKLGRSCMLMRACMEAGFHANAPADARLTREATYKSYRKIFTSLQRDGGDTAKQCTTMAGYLKCK